MTIEEIIKLESHQILGVKRYENELKKYYHDLFRETLIVTCGNCVADALFRIRYHLKKQKDKIMVTKDSLFKLYDNQVLYVHAWHQHITNDNLTDEIALALLHLTTANIRKFEKYPENWRDLVSKIPVIVIKSQETNQVTISADIPKEVIIDDVNDDLAVTKSEITVEEIIKKHTKDDIIRMLNEHGVIVPENTSAKKYDLALTLVAFLKKQ